MSKDIFGLKTPSEKPKRNTFDLSFDNNLSFKIGDLVPVMCKEVIPGDSFNIDSAFALRLMPMNFPVQTRMRARLHFFYVRNRNLWNEWKKFYRGRKTDEEFPTIGGSVGHLSQLFRQNGLADYLGCPTNLVETFKYNISSGFWGVPMIANETSSPENIGLNYSTALSSVLDDLVLLQRGGWSIRMLEALGVGPGNSYIPNAYKVIISDTLRHEVLSNDQRISIKFFNGTPVTLPTTIDAKVIILQSPKSSNADVEKLTYSNIQKNSSIIAVSQIVPGSLNSNGSFVFDMSAISFNIMNTTDTMDIKSFTEKYASQGYIVALAFDWGKADKDTKDWTQFVEIMTLSGAQGTSSESNAGAYSSGSLKISALPFRAYEAVYNAIYRNTVNDPFLKNGQPEYDEFITTNKGGVDTTEYHLFQEGWGRDFLTEALPTPQDGNAPLLGFSSSEPVPPSLSNEYRMQYTMPGGDVRKLRIRRDTSNGNVVFNLSSGTVDAEQGELVAALDEAVKFGISINDLRNTNSIQRWLEKNISRGYRYKDVIEAHFGIEISLRELEMPEFLGGVSADVNVNGITQTSESNNTPLGWQAGQGGVFANMKHQISKYCDEHGFIIGILSVVPMPSYSQLLPKFFTKFNHLDYYSPEFAHIGLQSIPYREVCPLQAHNSGLSLDKTFGYQRAWYDYISSWDEVHGEFRGSLSDFLITRHFAQAPVLGQEFLTIDPSETNNIFTVTAGDDHKVYGQVAFKIHAKRPIPLYNEPRLE